MFINTDQIIIPFPQYIPPPPPEETLFFSNQSHKNTSTSIMITNMLGILNPLLKQEFRLIINSFHFVIRLKKNIYFSITKCYNIIHYLSAGD